MFWVNGFPSTDMHNQELLDLRGIVAKLIRVIDSLPQSVAMLIKKITTKAGTCEAVKELLN